MEFLENSFELLVGAGHALPHFGRVAHIDHIGVAFGLMHVHIPEFILLVEMLGFSRQPFS